MKKYKIAILDRDGVINKINKNKGYIGRIKDFDWQTGAKKTIKFLKNKGYKVVVVTNQSGVARGYFKYSDVLKLHRYINFELKKNNTLIDKFYFCPHHKDGKIQRYKLNCNCRKPKNGQFKKIKAKWNIDMKQSFMVGDQITDIQFARKSKLKGLLFKEKNLYNFMKKKLS